MLGIISLLSRAGGILKQQRRTPVRKYKEVADIGARRVHLSFHELAQVLVLNEPVVDVLKVFINFNTENLYLIKRMSSNGGGCWECIYRYIWGIYRRVWGMNRRV